MSDTGWVSPTNNGNFDTDATNPAYAYSDDSNYAVLGISYGSGVRLSPDVGSTMSDLKTLPPNFDSATEEILGSSSDTWGRSWTTSEINSNNFVSILSGTDYYGETASNVACDWGAFGFDIPAGSTINGREVKLDSYCEHVFMADYDWFVDHIQIKVYYTETGTPTVGTKYALPAFKRP
jgi:hypothetical protein